MAIQESGKNENERTSYAKKYNTLSVKVNNGFISNNNYK